MSSINIETAVTCVGSVFVGLTDGMLSQLIGMSLIVYHS